jgi:tetratricopeptide (TPR) repeat protein
MGSDATFQLDEAVLITALKSLITGPELEIAVLRLRNDDVEGEVAVRQNSVITGARIVGVDGTGIQALRRLLPMTKGTVDVDDSISDDFETDLKIDLKKLLRDIQAASDKTTKEQSKAQIVAPTPIEKDNEPKSSDFLRRPFTDDEEIASESEETATESVEVDSDAGETELSQEVAATFQDEEQNYHQEATYQAPNYQGQQQEGQAEEEEDGELEKARLGNSQTRTGLSAAPLNTKVGKMAISSLIKRKKADDTTDSPANTNPESPDASGITFDIKELNSIAAPNPSAALDASGSDPLAADKKKSDQTAKVRSISLMDESEESRKAKVRRDAISQTLIKNKFKIAGVCAVVIASIGGFILWQKYAENNLAEKIDNALTHNKMDDLRKFVAEGSARFPNVPKFHFYKGRLLTKEGKMKEALAEYLLATDSSAEPYNLKYVAFRAQAYNAVGDTTHALEDLNRVLEFPITDYNSYLNRAVAYMATGNYEGAVTDAKRAVTLAPAKISNHALLAVAYNMAKKYKESNKEWTWVITKDPKNVQAYVGRASAEFSVNQSKLAFDDLSKSIALKPNANAYYSRGMQYALKNNFKNAIADFAIALNYEPKNPVYLAAQAKAYASSGDSKKAMAVYKTLSSLKGNLPQDVLLDRITTEITNHNYRLAAEDLGQLVEKDPKNVSVRLKHADICEKSEEFTKAYEDYSFLIGASPKNASYYAKRGWISSKLRHFDQSDADFQKASGLDVKNKNADICLYRGMSNAERGEYGDALQDIARALKLDPNNAIAKQQSAEILKRKQAAK